MEGACLQIVAELQGIEQAQAARDLIVAGRELRAAQPEIPGVREEAACQDNMLKRQVLSKGQHLIFMLPVRCLFVISKLFESPK